MLHSNVRMTLALELLLVEDVDFCVSPNGCSDVNLNILNRVDALIKKYPVLENVSTADRRLVLLEFSNLVRDFVEDR